MTDASGLHCPNCGAAAEPDAGRCPYCRARLATVSCPACFALMFDGARFCPSCGAARSRIAQEETACACPACRSEMHRLDVGTTPLLECASCDGVWVDAEVFERLCADRTSQSAILPRLTVRAPRKTVEAVRYRPCVRCGKMMNRVNFGALSGAVVDVCKGHGTFLDGGELHQIVTFILDGGLERARARKMEDLRDEQKEVQQVQWKEARDRLRSPGQQSAAGDLALENAVWDLLGLLTDR